MSEPAEIIRRRAGRSMTGILGLVDDVEDEWLHDALRKVVLDEINELADLSCRLIGSVSCDHVMVNQHYLELLERLERHLADTV